MVKRGVNLEKKSWQKSIFRKDLSGRFVSMLLFFGLLIFLIFASQGYLTGFVVGDSDNSTIHEVREQDVNEHSAREVSIAEKDSIDDSEGIEVKAKTVQYGAVLGKPVRWKKEINLSESSNIIVEVPKGASNITISTNLGNFSTEDEINNSLTDLNETENGTAVGVGSGEVSEDVGNSENIANETDGTDLGSENETDGNSENIANETEGTDAVSENQTTVETENETENSQNSESDTANSDNGSSSDTEDSSESVDGESSEGNQEQVDVASETDTESSSDGSSSDTEGTSGSVITGDFVRKIKVDINGDHQVIFESNNFFSKFFRFFASLKSSGRVIAGEDVSEVDTVEINEPVDGAIVEYETPAPYALETENENGKEVKIVGPEEVHYEDILAFTDLSENLNIVSQSEVRIYWKENETYLDGDLYDLDENGIYDYVEWIVPHLSNQTFDIIVVTSAEHLDSNRSFISDVYDEVRNLDGIWSETISTGEYVRITFEHNLTSERDITLYSRTINGTPKIEVYEKNGNSTIAEFDTLNNNTYNKVYLQGLEGEQDTFDLLVLNGSVEFDYIVDPVSAIEFVSPTPANASSQSNNGIYVNLSTTSVDDHYSLVDFDNDLVLWMRMDDVNASGDPTDLSSYGNNGSLVNGAIINSTGYWGNASWFNQINSQYIQLPVSDSLDLSANYTIAGWIYPLSGISGTLYLVKRGADSSSLGPVQYTINYGASANRISFVIGDGSNSNTTTTASSSFPTGQWSFFACRLNASNDMQCFANGVASGGSTPLTITPYIGSVLETIGNNRLSAKESFNGSIDEVLIFNRSLSDSEIMALYNASANKYENNFTSLVSGSHVFTGYGVDITGDLNQTETRTVEIAVAADTTDPVVTLQVPVDGANVSSDTQYFNATFTDNIQLANSTFYLWNSSGSNINMTFSVVTGTANETNLSVTLPYEDTFTWNYEVYDNSSNLGWGSSNYSINYTLPDTSAPNVTTLTLDPANNTAYSSGATYQFNATVVDDTAVGSVLLEFNGTNYTTNNLTADVYNLTLSNLAGGTYNYIWYANDSSGNVNNSESGSYTIARATSEVNLTLNNSEANVTIAQGEEVLLNGTLISGDSGATLRLYNNGTLINQGSLEVSNLTNFTSAGLFNITVIYVQSQNYSQSSETYYVNVTTIPDTTPPGVILLDPSNGTNTTTNQTYFAARFTDSSLANSTLYIWNSSSVIINQTTNILTGTANSSNLSVVLPYEGTYYWNYEVYDDSNNGAFNESNYTLVFNSSSSSPSIVGSTNTTSNASSSSGSGLFVEPTYNWKTTYIEDSKDLGEQLFVRKPVGSLERFRVKLNGVEHYVGVKKIDESNDKVVLVIQSYSRESEIVVGMSRLFDLDADGYYDLEVSLLGIENGFADISARQVQVKIPEKIKNIPSDEQKGSKQFSLEFIKSLPRDYLILSATAIMLLIFIIVVFYKLVKK